MSNPNPQHDHFEALLRTVRPAASRLENDDEFVRSAMTAAQHPSSTLPHVETATHSANFAWKMVIAACVLVGVSVIGFLASQKSRPSLPPTGSETGQANSELNQQHRDTSETMASEIHVPYRPEDVAYESEFDMENMNRGLFAFAWKNRFRSNGKHDSQKNSQIPHTNSVLSLRKELLNDSSL